MNKIQAIQLADGLSNKFWKINKEISRLEIVLHLWDKCEDFPKKEKHKTKKQVEKCIERLKKDKAYYWKLYLQADKKIDLFN